MTKHQHNRGFSPIPGFDGYIVSRKGEIRSCWGDGCRSGRRRLDRWKTIKGSLDHKGYKIVNLAMSSGRRKFLKVHRAVLMAFVGPCPKSHQACHRDNDKTNNHASNLYWGTPRQNKRDSMRSGIHARGPSHGKSKINPETRADMLTMRNAGESYRSIARRFGVSNSNAWQAINGQHWSKGELYL